MIARQDIVRCATRIRTAVPVIDHRGLIPELVQSLQSIPRHIPPPSGAIVLYARRSPCNRQQPRLSNLSIV